MEELAAANRQALALLLTGDRELWTIVAISFSVSLRAILIAAPIALGSAFLLAHMRFPGRRLLISACNTLMALPAVVVGLTVYMLLSRSGPLGDLRLLFTQTAITLGAKPWQAMLTLMYEVRFGLIAALVAAFGRIIAEVGSAMMVGGNILDYTRNIPTAIALETSKGEFAQGIALGLVLLLLALILNFALTFLQGKGALAP